MNRKYQVKRVYFTLTIDAMSFVQRLECKPKYVIIRQNVN